MENELSNTKYINGELLDWLDDEFAFEALKYSIEKKTKESDEIIKKIIQQRTENEHKTGFKHK